MRRGQLLTRALVASAMIPAVALLAGCGPADSQGDGRLHVVTTIGMITDIVERVGGERVRVSGLMGPGIDPHLYKASAGDVRTLATADLIFYNGLHLEAAMAEVLAEMNGRIRTQAVTDGIPKERLLTPPEFDGQYDPHVWFDVTLWMSVVETISETLSEVDPEGSASYAASAEMVLSELKVLDEWAERRIQEVPKRLRILVTAHDAFNYFGKRYGFTVEGLLGLSTASEAGTGDVQRLVRVISESRVPAIFVESSIPVRTIEAVQAAVQDRGERVEIGGTLFSDAMGDPGTEEGTYVGMVRHNVNTIVDALVRTPLPASS